MCAIDSLYADQLKPFGRILRKRIAEHASGAAVERLYVSPGGGPEPLPDVDVTSLRAVCEACEFLHLEPEEGGDWSATVVGRPASFIDVYSMEDEYPVALWQDAERYFSSFLTAPDKALPGGRYACAQALMSKRLDFLKDCSLGQVCHIVQLAITQRKILGYCNGAVVPYSASQSMMKETMAVQQQPCATGEAAAAMPLATWAVARNYLREILQGAATDDGQPAQVPLSNVKRLFRSRYQTELSETMLGHSRLSDLIQDERFADLCSLELQKSGYVVVQKPPSTRISLAESLPLQRQISLEHGLQLERAAPLPFCVDDPLCLEDLGQAAAGEAAFLPMSTPLPSPGVPASATVKQWLGEPHRLAMMPDEPTSDDSAETSEPRRVLFCPDEPLCFDMDEDCATDAMTPLLVSTPLPSPGEPPSATVRRWTGLTGFFAATTGEQPQPKEEVSLGETHTCPAKAWTSAPARVEFCPDEPLSLEEIQPGLVEAPTPLASPGVPGSATVRRWAGEPKRLEFFQERPAQLESPATGGRAVRRKADVWTPRGLPSFSFALSALSGTDGLVQNTFIHAKQAPPTPLMRRRAHSLPRDVAAAGGCSNTAVKEEEAPQPTMALQHALADLEPLDEKDADPCVSTILAAATPGLEAVATPCRWASSPVSMRLSVRNTFIHSSPAPGATRVCRSQSTPPNLNLCRGATEALDQALRGLPDLLNGIESQCDIMLPLTSRKSPCASGLPAFVPLSPAFTASPVCPSKPGHSWLAGPRPEGRATQQVVRLADYV